MEEESVGGAPAVYTFRILSAAGGAAGAGTAGDTGQGRRMRAVGCSAAWTGPCSGAAVAFDGGRRRKGWLRATGARRKGWAEGV